jgi:hypothetical protein
MIVQYTSSDLLTVAIHRIEILKNELVNARALVTAPKQAADRVRHCIKTAEGISDVLEDALKNVTQEEDR